MNIEEARILGFDRGRTIASYTEVRPLKSISPEGYIIEDIDDQKEWFVKDSYEAETANIDFNTFKFTSHELNSSEDPEELWDAFEDGICEGVKFERDLAFDNEPY